MQVKSFLAEESSGRDFNLYLQKAVRTLYPISKTESPPEALLLPTDKGQTQPLTEAAPLPDNYDPIAQRNLEKLFSGGFKMIYRKGTKQITILRFLIAKFVYSETGLGMEEYFALYDLLGRMLRKAEVDKGFQEKYEEWLITISLFLKELRTQKVFPMILNPKIRDSVKHSLKPLLPSEQAYYGYVKDRKIMDSVRIRFRSPLIPEGKVPKPKRVIGVGYRDHGQLRNKAVNGNPSWQEVATSRSFTELTESTDPTVFLSESGIKVPLTVEDFL